MTPMVGDKNTGDGVVGRVHGHFLESVPGGWVVHKRVTKFGEFEGCDVPVAHSLRDVSIHDHKIA